VVTHCHYLGAWVFLLEVVVELDDRPIQTYGKVEGGLVAGRDDGSGGETVDIRHGGCILGGGGGGGVHCE